MLPTIAGQASNGWGAACAGFYHPVRTGRPTHNPTTSPPIAFDPCSHRGTCTTVPDALSLVLRPLFAQGDRSQCPTDRERLPSTPVRTGRPMGKPKKNGPVSFDPCSHRETFIVSAQYIRNRQPSFHAASATPLFRINFDIIVTQAPLQ